MGIRRHGYWNGVVLGPHHRRDRRLIRYTAGAPQARAVTQLPHYSDYESPEQMLAARFARGEVDETEYRHRLDVLRATARQ